jgi:glyoxalase family protein
MALTEHPLGGLHHLTAVTGDTSVNVAFYTQVLGLRLVKQTVNQDDVSAYHLFYGDEVGRAGTEVTFFDWPALPTHVPGVAEVARTALRVPDRAALAWWSEWLTTHGVGHTGVREQHGRAEIGLADPEGQRLTLIDGGGRRDNDPWPASPVPAEVAIRGLGAVTLMVRQIEPTARLLTEGLGFRRISTPGAAGSARFEVGPGGPGAEVEVVEDADLTPAQMGRGGVHHVAFRVPDDATHRLWRQHLATLGVGVTPVIDRFYFRSIYFREPGGVLFEIATDGPGFATDEDPAHLGERLALPPFLEPRRSAIEAGLHPLIGPG